MEPISISRGLFGNDTQVSVQFGAIAVAAGVISFGAGVLLNSVGFPGFYGWIAYGLLGCGFVLAAVHTYRNSGLIVSWVLVFWPAGGAFAYGALAADMKSPPGKSPILTDLVLSWVYAGGIAALVGGTVIFGLVTGIRWFRGGDIAL